MLFRKFIKEEFAKDGVMIKKSKDFFNWTKCPIKREFYMKNLVDNMVILPYCNYIGITSEKIYE